VGLLSGTKAVIFNNIPAHEVPGRFLDSLNFFVRDQGGGFMMVGGKHSFGSGGYFQSSIDELLPISMELKNDQRKLAVSMAIVMDRSGSMSATVPGAAGGQISKMQLANNGAAKAIELLGMMDSIAVYAVDSEPETIVRQQTIKGNKQQLMRKAIRVESMGGGIFVYTGLKYAWDRLKKSGIGTKHVILFTDAADSEEPGNYKELIKEMTDQGATISVIGLGSKTDSDAKFIEDIAKRGKGRMFYTERAVDIPKLFAQETVTLARSAFIEEPINTLATGHLDAKSRWLQPLLRQRQSHHLTHLHRRIQSTTRIPHPPRPR
jgi:Mg-chelatase subunit ChlD